MLSTKKKFVFTTDRRDEEMNTEVKDNVDKQGDEVKRDI